MRKNLGFTIAAIIVLGLGIGANTAIFSVVNAVLLKPLPYAHGERLLMLRERLSAALCRTQRVRPEMFDYRRQNRSSTPSSNTTTCSSSFWAAPNRAGRNRRSLLEFFDVFGAKPLFGRDFAPDDEKEGAPPSYFSATNSGSAASRRSHRRRQSFPHER